MASDAKAREHSDRQQHMDLFSIPLEYIVLTVAFTVCFLVLSCMLLCLCIYLSRAPDKEQGKRAGFVTERPTDASTLIVDDADGKAATPAVLRTGGYSDTQLLDNDIAKQSTTTQLIGCGYTVSQLQQADLLPPSTRRVDRRDSDRRLLAAFKSRVPRSRRRSSTEETSAAAKKRRASREEEDEQVRRKRSPEESERRRRAPTDGPRTRVRLSPERAPAAQPQPSPPVDRDKESEDLTALFRV